MVFYFCIETEDCRAEKMIELPFVPPIGSNMYIAEDESGDDLSMTVEDVSWDIPNCKFRLIGGSRGYYGWGEILSKNGWDVMPLRRDLSAGSY